jgi:hypothetical protein
MVYKESYCILLAKENKDTKSFTQGSFFNAHRAFQNKPSSSIPNVERVVIMARKFHLYHSHHDPSFRCARLCFLPLLAHETPLVL